MVSGAARRTEDLELLGNGSLVLWRVSLRDEGQYTCSAENGVGEPLTKTVSLKINGEKTLKDKTVRQMKIRTDRRTASGQY